MDEFFESNPGMSSRIAHHLDFAPYTLGELLAIGNSMLDRSSYYLSPEAELAFRDYLTLRMGQPASPTPAASATSLSGPGSGTPTGWRPTRNSAGPRTTSCGWSQPTSSPTPVRRVLSSLLFAASSLTPADPLS